MKRLHVPIFVIALVASLLFHGVLWTTTRLIAVRPAAMAEIVQAHDRPASYTFTLNEDRAGVAASLPLPPPNNSSNPKQPTIVTLPPPPPPVKKPDVEQYPDQIGRQDGKGIGTHDAEGPKPVQGRVAENDQPLLSRDPRGPAWPAKPAESTEVPGEGGSGGQAGGPPAPQAIAALPPTPPAIQQIEHAEKGEFRPGPIDLKIPTHPEGIETPATKIDASAKIRGPLEPEKPGAQIESATDPERAFAPSAVDPSRPRDLPEQGAGVLAMAPPPPAGHPAASPPPPPPPLRAPPATIVDDVSPATPAAVEPTPPTPQPQTAHGQAGRPGTPAPAADPAQQSDSESDAFSRIDGVVRQDGRLEVQFGRQVKTVRPHLPISGMIDAALGARSVTLRVSVGRDGNVTDVKVSKRSGSNEVDQASLLAMYDWWFEPAKDKKGQPVEDTVYFTLNFR